MCCAVKLRRRPGLGHICTETEPLWAPLGAHATACAGTRPRHGPAQMCAPLSPKPNPNGSQSAALCRSGALSVVRCGRFRRRKILETFGSFRPPPDVSGSHWKFPEAVGSFRPRSDVHAHTRARTPFVFACARTRTHANTHTHARKHARTRHTRTRMRTGTHAHTHTQNH